MRSYAGAEGRKRIALAEHEMLGRPKSDALTKLAGAAVAALVAWFIVAAWRQSHAADAEFFTVATVALGTAAQPGDVLRILAERARDDPMASTPFVEAGLITARAGQDAKAAAIMKHAVRLNPRDRGALAWLFTNELRRGEFAAAIVRAHLLYRLEPALEQILSRTLAILAELDGLRALIVREFRATPYLRSILSAAPADSLSAQASLELIAALEPSARAGAQEQFLNDRLSKQDYAGVTVALSSFGHASDAGGNLLYDGSFRQLVGPRPFNWALTADGDMHATPVETGLAAVPAALHIERFGLASAIGARQSLLVQPGRYRLSTLLKAGDVAPDLTQPAPFAWLVSCPGLPRPELARFPFGADLTPRWAARSWTFEVPSSCGLIELSLTSSFADAAVHADALLTRVRLDRASQSGAIK